MEMFKEAEINGNVTLILDGKVLVVYIELSSIVVTGPASSCSLSLSRLHTPHLSGGGGATTEKSISMNEFLTNYIWESVYHDSRAILDWMMAQEGDSGLRCLNDIDVLRALAAGSRRIGKFGLRDVFFSLVDLSTARFRSQRHLWISTCSSRSHFPFHACRPPPYVSLCSSPRLRTSPSCASRPPIQPLFHRVSRL